MNERLSKRHWLGGREADNQLPAQHQALLFGVKAAEATQVHGHRPPLREAVPKTADSPNESGWFLSKMVHPAAARLCTPRMAEIRHIQTSEPFISANSAIVEHLNGLEGHLLSRIKGQDHVIPRVSECDSEQASGGALRSWRAGCGSRAGSELRGLRANGTSDLSSKTRTGLLFLS